MKRALLVGIDDYDEFDGLGGCVNDVDAILPLLARNEDDSPNFDCQTLTSDRERVTRDGLLEALDLLTSGGADTAVFYFAGHGSGDGTDVTLVVQDGTDRSPGVKLSELLGMIAGSPVREFIIILDCCFSGGAGSLPQLSGESAVLRAGVTIMTALSLS